MNQLIKLSSWNRAIFEKLILPRVVQKVPALYGKRRFIIVLRMYRQ